VNGAWPVGTIVRNGLRSGRSITRPGISAARSRTRLVSCQPLGPRVTKHSKGFPIGTLLCETSDPHSVVAPAASPSRILAKP
jgi:hypothetical protein